MFRGRGRGRLHTALFLAIGFAVTGFAVLAYGLNFFQRLELTTVDTRFAIRGERPTPRQVAVVGVDDVTFNELSVRWQTFPRSYHARVIDRLRMAGASVIAVDIQFTEPTTPQPGCGKRCEELAFAEDDALISAVQRARSTSPVVLATTEVSDKGKTRIFGGDEVVLESGARPANANQINDTDGVKRRFPYQLSGLKTFAVVAAELAEKKPVDRSKFPDNAAWIDFPGPPGAVPFLSYSRVLNGKFNPALVRNRVVVIGATAPSLGDFHSVPTAGKDEVMFGPELQANEIYTILSGFPLKRAPAWLNFLAICLLGMIPPFLGLRLSAIWTIVSAVALGGIYSALAQYAFNKGTIVAVIYPLGALALATVGALAAHYVLAAFERQRTRDTFSRFVPEEVVNQVLAQTGGELRLGGVRVVGTCMFTDLRGSTQFAESLPPETVVEVINRYLSALTEAILGNGGTLISYLGDGFMAVFGAPIEQEDHADRALAAAREILARRLPEFNLWFREQGYGDGFRIGVGLNTGPFMAGNVGSERRLEYTAMGDTINTGSRLEGSTKEVDYYMLMADSTREALLTKPDDLVEVGEVDVRGRAGRIKVWSVEEARKPEPVVSPEAVPAPAPA